MEIIETKLCVGGPLNGQRYATRDGRSSFTAPVRQKLAPLEAELMIAPVDVHHVTYCEENFRTATRIFTFWRPVDQSVEMSVEMLFGSYRP